MYRIIMVFALLMAMSEAWVTPNIIVMSPLEYSVVPSFPRPPLHVSHRLVALSASIVEPPPDATEEVPLQEVVDVDSTTVIIKEKEDPAETRSKKALRVLGITQKEVGLTLETKQKIMNGIFLAVCFGYAAYTILNIDAHMTRGWTQQEIAMRIPLDTWSNYESSLEEKPIYTKTLINVVIYLLGDWLSQTVFQGKNILDFDASRTLKNGFIGLCFGPLVHEYYQWSDHILPVDGPNSLVNRVEKICMDQTIYLSVKASIYVAAVSLLAGESWETAQSNVKTKIRGIVFTAWKFWPAVHCLTYSVIPAQHRILWVNCVDLVWNAILASMSRSKSTDEQQEEENAVLLQEAAAVSQRETSPENCSDTFVLGQEIVVPPPGESLFDEPYNSTVAHVLPISNGTMGFAD